jgi:hypothetical protein
LRSFAISLRVLVVLLNPRTENQPITFFIEEIFLFVLIISCVMPSEIYSWLLSFVAFSKGKTAIDFSPLNPAAE